MFVSAAKRYAISSLSTLWKKTVWFQRELIKFEGNFRFEQFLSVTILFPYDWPFQSNSIFWPQFWSHLNCFKGKIAQWSLTLNPCGEQWNLSYRYYSRVNPAPLQAYQYGAEDGRDVKPLAVAAWAWGDSYQHQLESCSTNEVPGKTLQSRAKLGCLIPLLVVFILH